MRKVGVALVDWANKQFWQSRKLIEIAKDFGVTIDGSPHNGANDASVDIAATST
jgi:hypothetical protein